MVDLVETYVAALESAAKNYAEADENATATIKSH